ncbi:39S ribosomal protein L47, mitochondrial-like [Mya arenaria]|uniref:39S ribosomal protein L47, mitochondrial-like n=1 Tax=Mya arenaria TaxID=6604 RepID=UPI0022E6B87C|nr:39S ribosomal protein L47, mitochondrial-like [Mya arenaria]
MEIAITTARRYMTTICLRCLRSHAAIKSLNISRVGAQVTSFHTAPRLQHKLDDFFEMFSFNGDEVATGRPWRLDELRLKSNQDLHKLWYVLLKERNKLMTMEDMYAKKKMEFVNPERIYKVEESMENILEIVQERDTAYRLLEFGDEGQSDTYVSRNAVGIPYEKTKRDHYIPKEVNKKHQLLNPEYEAWMGKHLPKYEERLRRIRNRNIRTLKRKKEALMKQFDMTEEELEEIEELKYDESNDELKKYLKMTVQLNDHKK